LHVRKLEENDEKGTIYDKKAPENKLTNFAHFFDQEQLRRRNKHLDRKVRKARVHRRNLGQ